MNNIELQKELALPAARSSSLKGWISRDGQQVAT